jgi:hypothetical protein
LFWDGSVLVLCTGASQGERGMAGNCILCQKLY